MYETKQNRQTESSIATQVASLWGLKDHETPKGHAIDRYFTNEYNRIIHFVEIKRAYHNFGKFPYYLIDLTKVSKGRYFAEIADEATWRLIVRWDDVIGWYEFNGEPLPCYHGGRTKNTRDAFDIEPVVHIPLKKFNIIQGIVV